MADRVPIVGYETVKSLADDAARVIAAYDAQGYHRTGTAVDRRSAEWLVDEVRAAGAEPVLEAFALDRVEPEESFLEFDGRRIEGFPAFDAACTDDRGITGTFGPPGSDATIALLETTPNGEYHTAFTEALTQRAHRGFVVMTRGGLPGLAPVNAPRFTDPIERPVLMAGSEEADCLAERAARRMAVRLVVRARRVSSTAYNVTAQITGTEPTLAPVVVMTPRSSWWQCASERGGGLVCWLVVLRAVARTRSRRTFLFTANSGHELGHLGLIDFLSKRAGLGAEAHAWIHYGANIGARGSRVRLQCADESLQDVTLRILEQQDIAVAEVVGPGQQPVGEARNIAQLSGRYLSLLGTSGPTFHHPADRWPDAVDIAMVARLAAVQAEMALHVAAISG